MKTVMNFILLLVLLGICMPSQSHAQIVKKSRTLLNKAKDILTDEAEKDVKEGQTNEGQTSPENQPNSSPGTKGKKLSPPDVPKHLTDARPYLEAKNFSAARFEIQQALLGVELQLGQKVLDDMPKDVNGMAYEPDSDELSSQGMGFAGLVIGRQYSGKNRSMHAALVNNSLMITMYNSVLSSSNYSSSDGEYKAVNVQGKRGAIKFDGSNTYELGVPLGQNSLFMLNCSDFADENEVLAAAAKFNLQQMMTLLGEQ